MTDDMHDKPVVTIHQVVVDELANEVRRLSAINDDMLAALEAIVAVADENPFCAVGHVVEHNAANIRQVIAHARGK